MKTNEETPSIVIVPESLTRCMLFCEFWDSDHCAAPVGAKCPGDE